MNHSPNTFEDIANAFKILGKNLPGTPLEIKVFLAELDAGEIELPELPVHLSPQSIMAAIREGRVQAPAAEESNVVQFNTQTPIGLGALMMAARNGDGPLSEETIRKMEDAQNDCPP